MIIAENEKTVVAGAGNNYVLAEERKFPQVVTLEGRVCALTLQKWKKPGREDPTGG